ncbi:DNA-nicking endonuclease, Smr domain [Loktanella fryxellensis]|uniref:DNA-nicking endonuclease, Smr domain n=1 Tax=Loktanella fryxellensis TaxID=245187 RepID=A0A1H8DXY3_9RHOB|nr:Smr/MutS family protein [Loktanella fryxellensis]SEN12035.1 DNA-nicking endonuclease, Smr domain [Loktanella fryxellensis]
MRRPRHLSPDDKAVWDMVRARVQPLHAERREAPASDVKPTPPRPMPDPAPPLPSFAVGARAEIARPHDILPPLRDRLRSAPIAMDTKSFLRMKAGKLKPEGRIDLHGMYQDEAYPELIAFILKAQGAGKRLVLVITGKGRLGDGWAPDGRGVLRRLVPQWLQLAPLAQAVMEVRPAHLKHGGDGAYYVYLRRRK